MSLPPTSSSPSNQNHTASANILSGSSHAVSGAISINLRNTAGRNNNNNGNESASNAEYYASPVSLPAWSSGEKRSVKELAASLARQTARQEPELKKKSDSLPRNVPAPTSGSANDQPGLHALIIIASTKSPYRLKF